jgi:thioredoxin-dependent peroxiredoxin
LTHEHGPGEAAPDFSLPAAGGETLRLSTFRGRFLVLYFYPKDDTPGCTNEALAFSSLAAEFGRFGAQIVGVSRDSISSHERFIAKHALTIRLASDESGAVCEAYGVWKEKKLYGRAFMGVERTTFLIGPTGKIEEVWRKVRVPGHAEAVLASLESRAAKDRRRPPRS